MKPIKLFFSLIVCFLAGHISSFALAEQGVIVSPLTMSGGYAGTGIITELAIRSSQGVAYTAFTTTEIVTALGNYCRDDNKRDLITSLLLEFAPSDSFTVLDGILDEEPLPNLEIGGLVKPGLDPAFSPTAGALSFGARKIKVRDWKVDLLITPKLLEKTWLGLYKKNAANIMELPFEEFIIDHIKKKIRQELRTLALFRGVYNAAGSTASDVMSGMDVILKAERTAGNITATATGAITSTNVIDKLLSVYDDLSPALKEFPTIMPVSSQIYDWASRKYEPVLNASLVAADRKQLEEGRFRNSFPLPGSNCIVQREPGKGSSQFVYVTSKENCFFGTDTESSENDIRFQEFDRSIKLMIDGKCGVEVGTIANGMIAVNDQA